MEDESREVNDSIRVAKKRLRPQGSFNAQFWSQAAEVENLLIQRTEIDRKVSLGDFDGLEAEWQATEKAKEIFEELKAHKVQHRICSGRAEKLAEGGKRSLRASFVKFFTTSKMGLDIKDTGAGKRDRSLQAKFRNDMMEVYLSKHREEDWLWCPILGEYFTPNDMTAGHLFAYMHGQDAMDAIFGPTKSPELFSPCNGLLINTAVEKYFDSGKVVIVPDLADCPTLNDIKTWVMGEVREYKVRIIDQGWNRLHKRVHPTLNTTWADLHNKRLKFLTSFRPRARYLYFHYCIQVLRYIWRQNPEDAVVALKDESGKPFWATPGRYINKTMLKAFVEELGHDDYQHLLHGASRQKWGDASLLLDVASKQIAKTREGTTADDIDDDDYDDDDETMVDVL
jgi:hypothetical protein